MPFSAKVGLASDHVWDPAPSPHRGTAPNFWSMSIVAKWSPISATAEHLYEPSTVVNCYKKLLFVIASLHILSIFR